MKIFIDSADIEEIKYAYSMGICDGVTTNPSLIKKAALNMKKDGSNIDMKGYIEKILRAAKGTPVSLEVTATDYDGIVKQGRKIFRMFNPKHGNVYIKVPVNTSFDIEASTDAIRAIKTLSKAKIPVNCTLIFTPEQAMLAAKAGAKIVSPFAGRVDDYIKASNRMKPDKNGYYPAGGLIKSKDMMHDNGIVSGIDLVAQTAELFAMHGYDCEVLSASIRNTRQVRESALVGADIATLPFSVIKELLSHVKTAEGMRKFTDDIVPEYQKLIE